MNCMAYSIRMYLLHIGILLLLFYMLIAKGNYDGFLVHVHSNDKRILLNNNSHNL